MINKAQLWTADDMYRFARDNKLGFNLWGAWLQKLWSLGSFLPGDGVGGAGVHWNGHTWRPMPEELRLRSYVVEKFGAKVIPEGMTIEDWGVTYDELEPYFDRFEYVCGISGQAGNLGGQLQAGGNPFEGPRKRPFPLPPLPTLLNGKMFGDAAKAMGYHPFPLPSANLSGAYINEEHTS